MYVLATNKDRREMNKQTALTTDKARQIMTLLENDPRLVSKHTTRQYKSDLLVFEAWRGDRPLTKTLVEAYAAQLRAEGKAPSTINQRLAAIRWLARKTSDIMIDYYQNE